MTEFLNAQLLSTVLWTPLLGAILLAVIPKKMEAEVKVGGLIVSLFTFALSLGIVRGFDGSLPGMQFVENKPWIPNWGISYALGVDGISLWLVLLTTFLTPLVLLSAWNSIHKHEKEYVIAMLALEFGMLGAFFATDLLLFYVFFELMHGRTGGGRGPAHRRKDAARQHVGHAQSARHPREPPIERRIQVLAGARLAARGAHQHEQRDRQQREIVELRVDRLGDDRDVRGGHEREHERERYAADRERDRHSREEQQECDAAEAERQAAGKKRRGKEPEPVKWTPEDKAQTNFTDPEAKIMKRSNKGFDYCYNAQAVVDSEHQIIVAAEVCAAANDRQQAVPLAQAAVKNLAAARIERP